MSLFIGVIGLPNVGKSTLFNSLTHANVEASNYPFCTVEPNLGVVEVLDGRLDHLNKILNPESCTPTHIQFVDIAGLVQGASKGEGLGNKFLGHIREADALVHVVRSFIDERIAHVDGKIDPLRDIETVETELLLADLEVAENGMRRLEKILRSDPRAPEKFESDTIQRVISGLQARDPVRTISLSPDEVRSIKGYQFLSGKPVLYLANVGEADLPDGGPGVAELKVCVGEDNVIVISAQIESEILELPKEDREGFLLDLGLDDTGINRLILNGYQLLNLITFYTVANQKLRAWQLTKGALAPVAAGHIHSDMESGFIRAEVAAYETLAELGSMDALRAVGKLKAEGKGYEVKDGDVIQFLFQR